MNPRRVAIIGSTGSIGVQTLEVLSTLDGFTPCALGGGSNVPLLAEQSRTGGVECVAISDQSSMPQLAEMIPDGVTLFGGQDGMLRLVEESHPDILVSAVTGAAGLKPTLAAARAGVTIALANKESLVCAGELIMSAVSESGGAILPVDSEHSGLFQCMMSGKQKEIGKITITSSGGALRDASVEDIKNASVEDVLAHPTWDMGAKITVDSATLMNKALEMIEAHWLFGLDSTKIDVLIHPQSIVHAMVEFRDGSVIAQLAKPDMRLPISYALAYPDRLERDFPPLDLATIGSLTFEKVTGSAARVLELARMAIDRRSAGGTVLNGANEVAVAAFLDEEIGFTDIIPVVDQTFCRWNNGCNTAPLPVDGSISLDYLLACDRWSRNVATDAVSVIRKV